MMNLFSSFNPVTSYSSSLNWLIMFLPITMTTSYWYIESLILTSNTYFNKMMINQFKPSMKKINKPDMLMMISLMSTITTLNLTSLLPYTFSLTSHIVTNLSLALVLWTALMMNKCNNMNKLLCNLTPSNTPMILVPFMVMIELVSMMIQPITLSIRLTANVTAGHIMIILISQMYEIFVPLAMMLNMMMMILELGVSVIQGYVFSMLIIMYSK